MPELVIKLLGTPRVCSTEDMAAINLRKKSFALLAYLISEPRAHTRDRLAALLWPYSSDGRKLLRNAIYELKRRLGQEALNIQRDSLQINKVTASHCDIEQLRQLAGESDDASLVPALSEIEALCSGEFLEGFSFEGCEVMTDWCYAMHQSIARLRGKLLKGQVRACRTNNDYENALTLLGQWHLLDECNENVAQQRIELHIARGELRQAERVYEQYKERVYVELGVSPSTALAELILNMDQERELPVESAHSDPIPETKYLRSDSVFLAYQILGVGPRTLIVINGFMSHLEQIWENPELAQFYRRLAKKVRLVLFDKRGSGMSDRVADPPTPSDIANDIYAIVSALNLERVTVLGFSEGGAAAIEFADRFPQLTDNLILYGCSAKWTRDAQFKPALTLEQFEIWQKQLISQWGQATSINEFAPSKRHHAESINWWAKTMRLSSSPGEVHKILSSIRQIDVRSKLADVRCPVLILHKKNDRIVRLSAAEDLAKRAPGARLVVLSGHDHWFWTEQSDRICAHILALIN